MNDFKQAPIPDGFERPADRQLFDFHRYDTAPGRGLDVGTSNIVASVRLNDGASLYNIQHNAFLDVRSDTFTRQVLMKLGVEHSIHGEKGFVVGDPAFELADIFEKNTRRPMKDGMISPTEPEALMIERLVIGRTIGKPREPGEVCVYSVPANPIDTERSVVYHTGSIEAILRDLGYTPKALLKGHAVVFAELGTEDYTGIGISCGAGMFNICIAYESLPVMTFSTSRGGDWIDDNVAHAVGLTSSQVCAIKESGVDLNRPRDRIEEAICLYYRNLIHYSLEAIRQKFESVHHMPTFTRPVSLVCAGGTSMVKGFIDIFRSEFNSINFPIDVKEIRLARDPLRTVALGCLEYSLEEMRAGDIPAPSDPPTRPTPARPSGKTERVEIVPGPEPKPPAEPPLPRTPVRGSLGAMFRDRVPGASYTIGGRARRLSQHEGDVSSNGTDGQSVRRSVRVVPAAGANEVTSLIGTLRVLRRRGWILILVWFATFAAAAAFAFTRPKYYRSEAMIEVAPEKSLVAPDAIGDSISRSSHLWESHFRTQESLLRRPGFLSRVLDALPAESVAEYRSASDPVLKLSEDLEVDTIPDTFLIRISLDHKKPDHGPDIVNTLVSLYIEDANQRLGDLMNSALKTFHDQSLPSIHQRVEESIARLQEFHSKQGIGDPEELYLSLRDAKRKLEGRLLDVKVRRIELASSSELRPEEFASGAKSFVIDPENPDQRVASLPELESERTRLELELARQSVALKEKHPAIGALRQQLVVVNNLIGGTVQTVLRLAIKRREEQVAALFREEQALVKEAKLLDERLSEAHSMLADFGLLQAEVEASRELYNAYQRRQGEVKASSGAGLTNVRVLELARAPQERRQKPHVLLAVGMVVGLLLGSLAVLVVEQVDDRVATPMHAETALGLDLLAVVSRMSAPPGRGGQPLVPEDNPITAPLEPFRRLRSEVAVRMQESPGPKVIAVVSAGYGEGKSTVAINLARVLALEGRQVLLVDADLRQPALKAFLGKSSGPGLEEYLNGGLTPGQCVQPSRIAGVHVIGPSRPFEGSAEVAGTTRFRAMWPTLSLNYDFVIVDTSPIDPVSETAVVASYADGAIFVVAEQGTRVREARGACKRLENHQVRILGLVMNRSLSCMVPRSEPKQAHLDPEEVSGNGTAFIKVG
ncbi:MAG: P-loop NTPase [Planctomycetes bacterium]|nr:P-loop NTPase [Planctomycetota bacterium]